MPGDVFHVMAPAEQIVNFAKTGITNNLGLSSL